MVPGLSPVGNAAGYPLLVKMTGEPLGKLKAAVTTAGEAMVTVAKAGATP